MGIVQLGLTTQWARPSTSRTDASIAVNAILAFGFFLLPLFSYAEHNFSTAPSFLLDVYLFVTFLFDIAKTRTLWLRENGGTGETIAALTSVIVALKCFLLLLEMAEKRSILRVEYKDYPPEAIGGIFNKTFFWWLNPLFRRGLTKSLAVEDLYVLDKQLSSKRLHSTLETAWSKGNILENYFIILLLTKFSFDKRPKYPTPLNVQNFQMADLRCHSPASPPRCFELLSATPTT